jgi:hypothetical protein
VGKLLWGAIRTGLWGLLLGPLVALLFVIGLMIFDPICSSLGDSGGCAMGLVTAPVGIALPSFALFSAIRLALELWRMRPKDWARPSGS